MESRDKARGTERGRADDSGSLDIDFGRTAADYDRYRPGFPDSLYDRLSATGWARAGLTTLDLGTGTGSLALGLAARGLHVVGLDPSPEMLDIARRRSMDLGLEARFVEGRAEDTGLDASSFDLVTAGHCWWWLDPRQTLVEVERILRPRGRLLIANFSYVPTPGSVAAATERLIVAHNPAWTKAEEPGFFEGQVRDLDAAGFADVESFSYLEPVVFTHEGWRGRMRSCSGVGASLGPAAVREFDRDLAALLAPNFPSRLVVPHRVFVVTGRVAATS
jgi:ubiquinone/menaquinone biosynthesis C-methylase UbiE